LKKKNGKKKRKKRKIGETGNRSLKKRGYIVPVRHERANQTQSDKSAEVSRMSKKKGKKKSKKKGEGR
jgi:hypothetical protein